MLKFPYPVKFIAANKREFNVKVTKPTKRNWWLLLLNPDGTTEKTIKISKTSEKLFYPTQKGGLANGKAILKQLLSDRSNDTTKYDKRVNRQSTLNRGKHYGKATN